MEELNKALAGSASSLVLDQIKNISVIPEQLWLILDRSRRRGSLEHAFDTLDGERFREPDKIQTYFQTIQMLGSDFARDVLAQEFSAMITFENRELKQLLSNVSPSWDLMPKVMVSGNVVEDAPERGSTIDILYSGYLKTLEHMAKYREFFWHCREDETIDQWDRTRLERRARAIGIWRLNLKLAAIKEVFDSFTTAFDERIEAEQEQNIEGDRASSIISNSVTSGYGFKNIVSGLVKDWMSLTGWESNTPGAIIEGSQRVALARN